MAKLPDPVFEGCQYAVTWQKLLNSEASPTKVIQGYKVISVSVLAVWL